jgi:hypothetical protein
LFIPFGPIEVETIVARDWIKREREKGNVINSKKNSN